MNYDIAIIGAGPAGAACQVYSQSLQNFAFGQT